jgi:hypothetical protein
MKRLGLTVLAVAMCGVAARPAMAQGHLRYGVHAGVLMPMGDYNTADKLGFVGGVGATYWLPGTGNLGIRADAQYSQTSHDVVGVTGNTKIFGAMGSFVYALMPASAPARLILNAGVGLYNVKIDAGGTTGSETKVGFGGGAALAFKLGTGSTRFVVASRFTSVSTSNSSTTFLPITVGLVFGK